MASIARSSLRMRPAMMRAPVARAFATTGARRAAYFPDEPAGPSVVSAIPGPKNKAAVAELDKVFDVRSVNMLTDYSKSHGN